MPLVWHIVVICTVQLTDVVVKVPLLHVALPLPKWLVAVLLTDCVPPLLAAKAVPLQPTPHVTVCEAQPAQAALASEQLAVVPPPEPAQLQVSVVPQAVAPLSPVAVPAVQVPPVAPQLPLTGAAHVASGLHIHDWKLYPPLRWGVQAT